MTTLEIRLTFATEVLEPIKRSHTLEKLESQQNQRHQTLGIKLMLDITNVVLRPKQTNSTIRNCKNFPAHEFAVHNPYMRIQLDSK